MPESIGSTTVVQVGIVTADIEKMIDTYMRVFGLLDRPVVRETDTLDKTNMKYRGVPSEARAKLAFIKMGQVEIELMEPIGRPSTWSDFLDKHGDGVHHIAFRVEGGDKIISFLQGQGMPIDQQGDFPGGRYTTIDSASRLGVIIELLENYK